jgi:dienelactone hydrolase
VQAGLAPSTVAAGPFTLTAFTRFDAPGQPVTVYIEGDGQAWVSRTRLSADPTPGNPVALALAAQERGSANVAYLGRPCQYGGTARDAACTPALWSSHRFSPQVVAAMDAAVSEMARRSGASGVHLVGFSGGGAIAALVAARRGDVASLRTVAGNLDHDAVNRLHGVSRLDGSLNPIDHAPALRAIPQIHYSGANDSVVPLSIAAAFVTAVGGPCATARVIPGASHDSGWPEAWQRAAADLPRCR